MLTPYDTESDILRALDAGAATLVRRFRTELLHREVMLLERPSRGLATRRWLASSSSLGRRCPGTYGFDQGSLIGLVPSGVTR